jgi:oxygen-dependent protoporphyrinogen oxidase
VPIPHVCSIHSIGQHLLRRTQIMSDVIIIGAGISGLSCAWSLKKLGIDSVILEESSRPGGVIQTEKINGYQVERGPNSLQSAPHALRLVDEVGLWDDLETPTPNAARYVYWDGKLRKVPFGPLTTSGILRILREPFVRSKSSENESVRDFFVRRVGRQAHDRLVSPALTGIFAGDTAKLSIGAVFPKIVEMEREHGSLAAAFLKSLRGRKKATAAPLSRPKPKGSIFSFPEGLEALPRRLAEQVNVQYNVKEPQLNGARVTVVASPAYRASRLLESRNVKLSALLDQVEYAPIIVAAVSVPDFSFKEPLSGFGFLVPRNQGLHLLGALFSSALFPGRAPKGHELLTCFIGGSFEPEALDWSDDRVLETVCSELKSALQTSEMPQPVALFRYRRAIPQYNLGHEQRVRAIKEELTNMPGVFISSNYLEGISVPACIEQGERTAHAVADFLGRKA